MNLAGYTKCLKRYALNKKISDEEFFNALLRPYIDAGEIENKLDKDLYFDKSRTSRILNRHEDVPGALRRELANENIQRWIGDNFRDFIDDYMNPQEVERAVEAIVEMIETDNAILDKSALLSKRSVTHEFLAASLIECIKLKNDGFDPEGEILRNGAFCIKVVYQDIFRNAFRKRTKKKNIVVIPVDTGFHTHVTRNYERKGLNEVSATSLHGQFLTRWEQSGEDIESLPQRIRENLQIEADAKGEYPLGTIATVEKDSTIFYLLAISEFDENNNAHSTREEIIHCIDTLSTFYDKHGDGFDLYIPLMGTGKSRAEISLQESYDILIECYRKNKNRIQGNIYIVIHKDLGQYVNTDERGE